MSKLSLKVIFELVVTAVVHLCLNVDSHHLQIVTFAKEERRGHGTFSERKHAMPLRERVDTLRTWIMSFAVTMLVFQERLCIACLLYTSDAADE